MKYIKNRNNQKKFIVPKDILNISDIFFKNGYKLYIVGGAVRDFKTKEIPKDYDLTTDALPNDVIRILSPYYKVQEQGKAFAVVVVYTENYPEGFEIATFRKDITSGRNPEVKIGGVTIEEDVERRDLTINSMFYDIQKDKIIDLVGGISDLKNKIIRMVGDPMKRIKEDSLRILRIFRFASRYGSSLDQKTIDAIHLNNDISEVSMERVWDIKNGEFMKSFKQAKDFNQYLLYLKEFGIIEQILPNLKVIIPVKNTDNLELVLSQMLINNDTKLLKKLLNKYKLPGYLIDYVVFLIDFLDFSEDKLLSFYKTKKRYNIQNNIIKKWIDLNRNNIQHYDILYKFISYKPSIDASDVMKKYNLKPSVELGKKINELEIELFNKL